MTIDYARALKEADVTDVKSSIGALYLLLKEHKDYLDSLDFDNMKPSEMVEAYVRLRDHKAIVKKKTEGILTELFTNPMELLEDGMRGFMIKHDIENIKSKAGTAYTYTATSVTTADGALFRSYVIENEAWELADWKPNKKQVDALIENGQPKPPGVNFEAFTKVGVRRPDAK